MADLRGNQRSASKAGEPGLQRSSSRVSQRSASKATAADAAGSRSASKATAEAGRSVSKATTAAGESGGGSGPLPGSPCSCRATSKAAGDESPCSSVSTAFGKRSSSVAQLKWMTRGPRLEADDFDLDVTVGKGSFGRVRVVTLKGNSDVPMALKILEKAKVLKMRQVQHVKDEVSILSTMEHPFIVNLVRTFQDSRRLYLLMEFVNGGELFTLIANRKRLADYHAKFYAAQCTLAFEYLHSMKVAYRDVKPENTLIDCDGCLKITDFGFAKVVEDRTFTVCGTPEYIAPEVIRTQGHGCGVDWWGLGILIFEMLHGSSPFAARNVTEIYQQALAMKVEYPMHFQIKAKDLIGRLLKDKTLRLGCRGKGAQEIKSHKWFSDIDWQDMYDREIPAPWIPSVSDASDTAQFCRYPESTEASAGPELTAEEQEHFNFMQPRLLD